MKINNSILYWFQEMVIALFVLLFLFTGVTKLENRAEFISAMKEVVGFGSAVLLSWIVPSTELITVLLLTIPKLQRCGMIVSFSIMIVFTVYVAIMLLSSSKLPCTCGGIIQKLSWFQHLWVNSILTALSFSSIMIFNKKSIAINRSSRIPANTSRQNLTN